jgi:membrane-associated phospholipid phosphatase
VPRITKGKESAHGKQAERRSGRRVLTAQASSRRPGTAPALGLRAGRDVLSIVTRTKGDFTMRLRKQSLLRVELLEDRCVPSADVVLEWNQLALHAVGQARVNPVVTSRALAITQAAIYDAVVAIDRSFEPYHANVQASHGASLEAAAAQAAHDTLAALFPAQASTFDAALAADLVGIPPGLARQGVAVGHEAARQILEWRSTDGSSATVPYTPGTDPGDWQPTPPAFLPALAPQWPLVTPFAMSSGAQFRPEAPPALDGADYTAAYNEVKSLGRSDSTTRTDEQTQIARFWNDGLGTAFAPGYWNKIAQTVATEQGLSLVDDARLFALVNIAAADAIISCWDAKYTYSFWRPVTAIRAGDTDGNLDTDPDTSWSPLLVTPNFPSYTSAHSTVSAAAAGVLTALFGTSYHFTVGAESVPFTRTFDSFADAAAEAGRSRIYGGIHYTFDNTAAQQAGVSVGQYVIDHFLLPRDNEDEQMQAAAAAPAPVSESLRADLVQPLLVEALSRWQASGIDTSALQSIDVRIVDLGGLTLGQATGGAIWLDNNAAGWGWFVDPTPWDDSEFATPGNQGEAGRMDLLTVLTHEVGHLLGHDHDEGGVMAESLTAGTRLMPGKIGHGNGTIAHPSIDWAAILEAVKGGRR